MIGSMVPPFIEQEISITTQSNLIEKKNITPPTIELKNTKGPIWWSNAIFFIGMHVMAVFGANYLSPWSKLNMKTFWLCITSWQLATFGITIGYHRLWSHRAFTASLGLRIVLAGMGCLGFQGSIKWWVLRHRLHHRFTDSDSDPYNANEGLYHSHVGWIFRKPNYPRMALIDRKDLEIDPVVRFQHKYYLPLTLGLGLVLPTLIGALWGDAMGGYVWGGIMARILIWHGTFCINSLAHYVGEQAYSEELSARSNFVLALFTGGEANHNYHHAFPKDYRNGPRHSDWDPTKWTIYLLHHFTPLIPIIFQTPQSEIEKAKAHVLEQQQLRSTESHSSSSSSHSHHHHHHHHHSHQAEDEHISNHSPPAAMISSSFAMWSSFAVASSNNDEIEVDGTAKVSTSEDEDSLEDSWSSSTSSDEEDTILVPSSSSSTSSVPLTSTSILPPTSTSLLKRRTQKLIPSLPLQSTIPSLPIWTTSSLLPNLKSYTLLRQTQGFKRPVILYLQGHLVDVAEYGKNHPGGVSLMMRFSMKILKSELQEEEEKVELKDCTKEFGGGLNDHGWSAIEKMKDMRIAKFVV